MSSLWKDLLLLHGHLLHKENPAWRPDPPPAQTPGKPTRKAKRAAVTCCAAAWPRIMGPR